MDKQLYESDVPQRKVKVKLSKIFYPKGQSYVNSGEYAIWVANVISENGKETDVDWLEYPSIKLKGNVCELNYTDTYNVTCQLADQHPTYGDTYEILFMNRDVDFGNKDTQKTFLESVLGDGYATKLLDNFDNVIELLENRDVEELTKIKGIKTQTALRLIEKFEATRDWSVIFVEIGHLGLTPKMISKLVQIYKSPDTVVDIVKNDPYRLVEVNGIGFKKADEIALSIGIHPQSVERVKQYIEYYLGEEGENGKSYLDFNTILNSVYEYLGNIPDEVLKESADQLKDENKIIVSDDGSTVALRKYYDLELNIAKELKRLNVDFSKEYPDLMSYDIKDYEEQIKDIELEQGFEFTDEQKDAIAMSLTSGVMAITAKAGSGKTCVSSGISKVNRTFHKGKVQGVCLAGRAALRLYEATGIESSTIHRYLMYRPDIGFQRNENNPVDDQFIILDETTMVSGELFYSLIKSIPTGSKLLMLGDINQLTPIGNCQVFNDVLLSEIIPIKVFTKIHRQAQKSGIIPSSISISNQEQIFDKDFYGEEILGELQDMHLHILSKEDDIKEEVVNHFMKEYDKYNRNPLDVQLVTMMRTRGEVSAYPLNVEIQNRINPAFGNNRFVEVFVSKDKGDVKSYKIRTGDKVINRKNNYDVTTVKGDRTEVFNGNIGIVKDISEDNYVTIDFEGIGEVVFTKGDMANVHLGYAITTHSGQGSQFPSVIVAMDNSSYILNNKEMLYTAITRARKHCTLVGVNAAIRQAINTKEIKTKQTFLKEFLQDDNVRYVS